MTVIGRQLAIQPKFREAKLVILCVGTKFDCRLFSPFWQKRVKLAEKLSFKESKPLKNLAAENRSKGGKGSKISSRKHQGQRSS